VTSAHDDTNNVIETHEQAGDFKDYLGLPRGTADATIRLDMQWLQGPSTPRGKRIIQILSAFNYRFFSVDEQ